MKSLKIKSLFLCVCCLLTVGNLASGRSITFDSRGYLEIDGQPRFIIGSYEFPSDEANLNELVEAGFNLVRASNPEQLDRLGSLGVSGWYCISPELKEGDEAKQKELRDKIDSVKNHPAMLIWELPDECLWNVWYRDGNVRPSETSKELAELHAESIALADNLQRGCEFLRECDPQHPIWQNHAPRNSLASLSRFNQYVDAAGCDIYPVPLGLTGHSDLLDQNITAVGAYTQRMRAAAEGKSCWMVLQGFGWEDLTDLPKEKRGFIRRPTWEETRFMAYDSIVNGANAILYYGTYRIEKDSSLWKDLLRIAKEIHSLEPLLVADSPEQPPVATATETYGSIDPEDGPKLLLRHRGNEWLLIAVNRRNSAVPFTVTNLPQALEGKLLKRVDSDETVEVKGGEFQDGIGQHGVHVYRGTSD